MTQYLMSVYMVEGEELPAPEVMEQMYKDVDAFNQEIIASGQWVFGGGLHPADTATVVKVGDRGDVITTDGPFPEAKEQLGGFWVVKCADLDEALALAARATVACQAPVEVRPFQDEPEGRYRAASWTARRSGGHRRDLPGRVRPECGHPGPPLRQHRHRRRGGPGRLRRRPRAVAGRRPAPEPGGLDHHHRPEPGHRPAAPRELPP